MTLVELLELLARKWPGRAVAAHEMVQSSPTGQVRRWVSVFVHADTGDKTDLERTIQADSVEHAAAAVVNERWDVLAERPAKVAT